MNVVALVAPLALVVLIASPAAAAYPVEGRFTAPQARLQGALFVNASEGALDLVPALRSAEPLALSWTRATGSVVSVDWLVAWDPTGARTSLDSPPQERRLDLDDGRLRSITCHGDCAFLLLARDGEGTVSFSGRVSDSLRWTDGTLKYWAHWSNGRAGSFLRQFDPGTFAASGQPGDVPALLVPEGRPGAEGRVGLFLTNVTLEIETGRGRQILDTTPQRSPLADVAGRVHLERVESRFAYLLLENARLDAPAGSAALLLAPRPDVALAGTLHAPGATGHLQAGGHALPFEDEPLRLVGSFALALATLERPVAGIQGAPSLQERLVQAEVRGEATSVRVGEASIEAPPAAQAASRGLLALGLAWLLQRGLFALFYSRITRSRVLTNDNRRRLHQLVCERPGGTTADLARASGLARVVVKHHLRMLEAHRLVVARRDGRRRRFFAAEAAGAADVHAIGILLQDANRRKVAQAMAASPAPLTQKELAALTGLSQRVVSNHLSRLAEADLLRMEGRMPKRYALAGAALARLASGAHVAPPPGARPA